MSEFTIYDDEEMSVLEIIESLSNQLQYYKDNEVTIIDQLNLMVDNGNLTITDLNTIKEYFMSKIDEMSDLETSYLPELNLVKSQLAENSTELMKNTTKTLKTQKPSFCIVDDDAKLEAYTYLIPMAESRGFKVTIAQCKSWVGETFMSLAQLKDAQARGHEIVSHAVTGTSLETLTEPEIEYELSESKRWLAENGFYTEHLMYPHGGYDERVVRIASKYYKSACYSYSTPQRVNNLPPISHYALDRIGVGAWGSDDWITIKSLIDTAIAQKTICVLMTHVGASTPEQKLLIEQAVDYILGLGYTFDTYGKAFEYHANAVNFGNYDASTRRQKYCVAYDGIRTINESGTGSILKTLGITDFNTVTNGGKYWVYYGGTSSNFPSELTDVGNAVLEVSVYMDGKYGKQILKIVEGAKTNRTYERTLINGVWGSWLSSDIVVTNKDAVDFNTVKTTGKYWVNFAKTGSSNFPTDLTAAGSGVLEVSFHSGGLDGKQVLKTVDNAKTNRTFERSMINGVWNGWVSLLVETVSSAFYYSVNFGTVPAQGQVEIDVPFTGATNMKIPLASPRSAMPNNLIWSTYIDTVDIVTIRAINPTSAPIVDSAKNWLIKVING